MLSRQPLIALSCSLSSVIRLFSSGISPSSPDICLSGFGGDVNSELVLSALKFKLLSVARMKSTMGRNVVRRFNSVPVRPSDTLGGTSPRLVMLTRTRRLRLASALGVLMFRPPFCSGRRHCSSLLAGAVWELGSTGRSAWELGSTGRAGGRDISEKGEGSLMFALFRLPAARSTLAAMRAARSALAAMRTDLLGVKGGVPLNFFIAHQR